jgi:hypothetical protein
MSFKDLTGLPIRIAMKPIKFEVMRMSREFMKQLNQNGSRHYEQTMGDSGSSLPLSLSPSDHVGRSHVT